MCLVSCQAQGGRDGDDGACRGKGEVYNQVRAQLRVTVTCVGLRPWEAVCVLLCTGPGTRAMALSTPGQARQGRAVTE